MVTVEEAEDAAAFAEFVAEAPAAPEEPAAPVAEASPPAPASPAPAPVAPIAPPVAEPEPVAPPDMEELVAAVAPTMSTGWGEFAKINSPISKTMSKSQSEYVEMYGTTGQVPL